MSSEQLGQFVWYDLMTSDPKAAKGFYGQLIGWDTQKWEEEGDQPYIMWTCGGQPLGGVVELPQELSNAGVPPHWIAYVAVDDVEAASARVRELGGKVVQPPTDVANAGRYAVFQDPQGATFAVYQTAEGEGAGADPSQVGRFSWNELATSDYKRAFSFYSELFGWQPQEAMDMGEAGIYQIYGGGGAPYGGMFNKPDEMPGPPMWLYYVKVDDVNSSVAKVKDLGGQVVNGPMEVPGGDLIAQCLDPQGALFALHSSA